MKHITLLTALAVGFVFALPAAQAQPEPRGRRMKMKRRPVKRGAMVRAMRPKVATPGSTVTLIGRGFHPKSVVRIGKQKVRPTSVTPRRMTFVIPPTMRPGPRPVMVIMGKRALSGGVLRVAPAGATPPPGPGMKPPHKRGRHDMRHRRRARWKRYRERPAVYGYSPRMGPVRTRIIVRGRNFKPDAKVFFGKTHVVGAKISPNQIILRVPRGEKSGLIKIRQPGLSRSLFVGVFDVKRGISKAERRKRQMERRRLARERWRAYQRKLAKSRKARMKAYRDRWSKLRETREERRRKRLEAIRAAWKAKFLADQQVRAELALHASRMARLREMLRLAGVDGRGKLAVRIQLVMDREQARHKHRMASLKAGLSVEGGTQ